MLRPRSLLPAVVAAVASAATVTPLLPVVPAAAAAPGQAAHTAQAAQAARRSTHVDALGVTIDDLTPSTLPRRGPVRVLGSVTNRSDETWQAVNLHVFVGDTPISSSADLAQQSALPAEEYVGGRITEPGTFDNVGDLAPGETAQYAIRVPRAAIGATEPGVYWFGVHALGESPQGRDDVADGRARTFLPLVTDTAAGGDRVDTALVIPVRRELRHRADGSIAGVRGWTRDLEDGPLRTLVDLGASAGSRPVTWLVDPAVPDAVRALVAGNPPRSLADTLARGGRGGGGAGDSDPEADPQETPVPTDDELEPTPATEPGEAWLDRLRAVLGDRQVLRLPYADLDVSAAVRHDPDTYAVARRLKGRELTAWEVPTRPAVTSPSGFVSPEALAALPEQTTVLLTDRMLQPSGGAAEGEDSEGDAEVQPEGDTAAGPAPALAEVDGREVVVTSSGAAAGGPGPGDRRSMVAMRQKILAEAALRLTGEAAEPLVVVLPQGWAPTSTAGFFEGLDTDWLRLTGLRTATRGATPEPVAAEGLTYPRSQNRRALDGTTFATARSLVEAGETLQNVLLRNDEVARAVREEALGVLSYSSRRREASARSEAVRSRGWILDQLGSVTVQAPRAVTLSSSTGRFSAVISNDLDQAVTVRVRALSDRPIQIEGPAEIEIGPDSRTSVLLEATTGRLGVHNVQLVVTDLDGTPLGSSDALPIRSAQVSRVIWLILGTGVALLFGAIGVRLVRRVRTARAERRTEGGTA
ncbi:DUF6049 family protein [Nocardioides sp. GCM10027113]|uniref:DUF6049 family protein n=1 Tax=unclassified Nocardioides TaxID=2615069 RepID=UPI003610B3E5